MPRTKASRRSAAAKKRMEKRVVAHTDGVMPSSPDKKVLTDAVPVSHSPPEAQDAPSSLTDGVVTLSPDEKVLTDGVMPFPIDKKAGLLPGSNPSSDITFAFGPQPLPIAFGHKAYKTFEHLHERVPLTVSDKYPEFKMLRGSFHQAHSRFGINNNKQCVANSVTAIMTAKVKNVLTWTVRDLDDVLINGDRLYSSIRKAGRIRDSLGYLYVTDLPTEHTLYDYKFSINCHDEMFCGKFGVTDYGELQHVLMSHDEAIRRVFMQFDACLFNIKESTCAIVKEGSLYVLIDSHSRNEHGAYTKISGTSVVAYHANIDSLLNYIMVLGMSLCAEGTEFEVTGVVVNVTGRSTAEEKTQVTELPSPSGSYKILLHNVEGLTCHVEDLRHDTRYMEADIICVTETWLQPNDCNIDIELSEFTFYSKPRYFSYDTSQEMFADLKDRQHGGVGVYYKQHTGCSIVDLPCINIECLQFILPQLNTAVAVLYRPPSYNLLNTTVAVLYRPPSYNLVLNVC
ncbi:uncharacterized protein LOC143477522 isoform X3 [Brachyhypopomus gauderio]|uniref:uncharacterized protein LOC143477522 isoform X3 n=1 Tax=Brachyhypopomus gauderio TaxID=698409 RepID=UPI0040423618